MGPNEEPIGRCDNCGRDNYELVLYDKDGDQVELSAKEVRMVLAIAKAYFDVGDLSGPEANERIDFLNPLALASIDECIALAAGLRRVLEVPNG